MYFYNSTSQLMILKKIVKSKTFITLVVLASTLSFIPHQNEKMKYADTTRDGIPFSKDPHVIRFKGKFLMYYSVHSYVDKLGLSHGWGIGIAESNDLTNWKRIGEVNEDTAAVYEKKGLAAPCALVINGNVHLFYQTYGNGANDAICHAVSADGIFFERDHTNPIFKATGDWNCGRAIDAEVVSFKGKYFLYYATRDKNFKIQMQGVAVAPGNSNFNRLDWRNVSTDSAILKPILKWEGECIEGASVIENNGQLFMFYAAAYNNAPQQVGLAKSSDGIHWVRTDTVPFLKNGTAGEWNSSESGHPHIFANHSGDYYLFFQGNNDNGKTWYISNQKIGWKNNMPILK